jgi:cob(I)alamin adenosyltransferase
MSIATKTGDAGTTALMYNRRVSKCDARVEAYGCIDELNASLGMARASIDRPDAVEKLLLVQKDLVQLMGEVATDLQDLDRYISEGRPRLSPECTTKLDAWIIELEKRDLYPRGWATPGATCASATLDVARTVCRRAERRVCALQESAQLRNPEIIVYLNRLSDWLWLLAREVEAVKGN